MPSIFSSLYNHSIDALCSFLRVSVVPEAAPTDHIADNTDAKSEGRASTRSGKRSGGRHHKKTSKGSVVTEPEIVLATAAEVPEITSVEPPAQPVVPQWQPHDMTALQQAFSAPGGYPAPYLPYFPGPSPFMQPSPVPGLCSFSALATYARKVPQLRMSPSVLLAHLFHTFSEWLWKDFALATANSSSVSLVVSV